MNDFHNPRPFRDASTRYAKHGPIVGMDYRTQGIGRNLWIGAVVAFTLAVALS